MYNSRNILLLSISRLVAELGAVSIRFALSLYILDVSGSPLMTGFVFAFTYIPGILINTFVGIFIDRSNKKKIIVSTDLLSGIFTLASMSIFIFAPENMIVIIAYIVILYTLQAIFMLALNSGIPEMVSQDRVINANSNIQGISQLVNIFGVILGATIYLTLGIENIFLLAGVCFVLSGTFSIFIKIAAKTKPEGTENKSYRDSLKEVYHYIKDRKPIKLLLLVFVAINFIVAPMVSNVLLYIVRDKLQMGAYEMAFIEAAFGVGCVIGAILVSIKSVGKFVSNKIFLLIQLTAVTLILWVFPSLPIFEDLSKPAITAIYMGLLTITGASSVMANIPMISYVQIYIPDHIRASIFGVISTITTISVPIGLLIFSALFEVMNWTYLVAIAGAALLIIGILTHRNKSLREFFNVDTNEEEAALAPIRQTEAKVLENI